MRSVVRPGTAGQAVLTADDVARRVGELGREISADHAHRGVLLVGVLGGAVLFTVDLARALHVPVRLDWVAVASQVSGTGRSGSVRLTKNLDTDPTGRDVVIVDAVMDTGFPLSWLTAWIAGRGARSITACVLLRTRRAQLLPYVPRYVGFDLDMAVDEVSGYGTDLDSLIQVPRRTPLARG